MDFADVAATMINHFVHESVELALNVLSSFTQVFIFDAGTFVTQLQATPLLGQLAGVGVRDIFNVTGLINDVRSIGVAKTLLTFSSEQVHATVLNFPRRSLLARSNNVDHLIVVKLAGKSFVVFLRVRVKTKLLDL